MYGAGEPRHCVVSVMTGVPVQWEAGLMEFGVEVTGVRAHSKDKKLL